MILPAVSRLASIDLVFTQRSFVISKLVSLFLATLILACPFNCMPASQDCADTVNQSCCSHCQPESQENPLIPSHSSTDCCQCFCSGAIIEAASQIDLTLSSLACGDFPMTDTHFQLLSLNAVRDQILFDPDISSGRQIRCLQMSFQC